MKLRSDRDIIDHLTLVIAGIALLASVVVPVTFRILDQCAKKPKIRIIGSYLHRLSMQENPELVNLVVNSWNLPYAMVESSGSDLSTYLPTLLWAFDHRIFRIKVTNRGDHPASLTGFTAAGLTMNYPGKPEASLAPGLSRVVALSADHRQANALPVVNLAPHETISLDLVVSTYPTAPADLLDAMAQKTKEILCGIRT